SRLSPIVGGAPRCSLADRHSKEWPQKAVYPSLPALQSQNSFEKVPPSAGSRRQPQTRVQYLLSNSCDYYSMTCVPVTREMKGSAESPNPREFHLCQRSSFLVHPMQHQNRALRAGPIHQDRCRTNGPQILVKRCYFVHWVTWRPIVDQESRLS